MAELRQQLRAAEGGHAEREAQVGSLTNAVSLAHRNIDLADAKAAETVSAFQEALDTNRRAVEQAEQRRQQDALQSLQEREQLRVEQNEMKRELAVAITARDSLQRQLLARNRELDQAVFAHDTERHWHATQLEKTRLVADADAQRTAELTASLDALKAQHSQLYQELDHVNVLYTHNLRSTNPAIAAPQLQAWHRASREQVDAPAEAPAATASVPP
jgi:hypothetical protein